MPDERAQGLDCWSAAGAWSYLAGGVLFVAGSILPFVDSPGMAILRSASGATFVAGMLAALLHPYSSMTKLVPVDRHKLRGISS